jgi:hypothetical protein
MRRHRRAAAAVGSKAAEADASVREEAARRGAAAIASMLPAPPPGMRTGELRHLATVLECLAEVASGLEHLHSVGMVHGVDRGKGCHAQDEFSAVDAAGGGETFAQGGGGVCDAGWWPRDIGGDLAT